MPRRIIEMMDDMHLSSQSTFLDYYYAMQTNNISYASTILSSNPSLANQITTADNINTLLNEVYRRELIPKQDIDYFLAGLHAVYESMILNTRVRGEWSPDIEYQVHNLVYYNGKGYYVYPNQNPPKGTLPTDTTYWREYDIRGYQGYGGINLQFKGNWDGTQNYVKNDIVIYQNKLWYAIADNSDYEPNLNHYPWVIITMPKLPNKTPIQRSLPTGYDIGDFWWQITQGDEVITTTWGIRQSEPTPRFASAAFSVGTKFYVVGGRLANFNETNINEMFDTETGTWTVQAAAPTIRSRVTGFTIGTTGYVIGGIDPNSNILNTVEAYDTTTNTWSIKANLPIPMISPGVSYNNKGYVIGGETTHNVLVGNSYVYDADANTWTAIADKPTLTHGHTVAASNSTLYAIGGIDADENTLGITESYDIATNTWSQKDNLNLPRSYLSSFVRAGNVYAVGGLNSNWYSMNTNEKYSIADNEWTSDMPMNYSRSSLNALISDTKGFAIGGIDMETSSILGYNEQYDITELPSDFEMTINTALAETNYITTQVNNPIQTEELRNLIKEQITQLTETERLTVRIPTTPTGSYNFIVDWGDGTTSNRITAYDDPEASHTYAADGEYTIKISGMATELQFTGTIASYLTKVTKCVLEFTSIKDMFKNCANLIEIPDGIFNSSSNIQNASGVFNGCVSLQIIPTNLFVNNSKITDFSYTFANTALTSIPTGLFDGSNVVTTFENTFENDTAILAIPKDLFANQSNVLSFEGTFENCRGLTTIPENLFANNPLVTTYKSVFMGCKGITSITKNIFGSSIPSATNMENAFRETGLTSIPDSMFANAPLVSNYNYIFDNTEITEIPANCFAGGTNASSVNAWDKTKITSIGDNALAGLESTDGMLSNMTALETIGNDIFGDNLIVATNMFNGDSNLKTMGNLNVSNVTDFTNIFKGCNNLGTLVGFYDNLTTKNPTIKANISFIDCIVLTHDSLLNISNSLVTMTKDTIQTLTLSSASLDLLTIEERFAIINKWWNIAGYNPTITEDLANRIAIGLKGDSTSSATTVETTGLYYYVSLKDSTTTVQQRVYAVTKDRGMIYDYDNVPEYEYLIGYSVNNSEEISTEWVAKGKDNDTYWADSYVGKLRAALKTLSEKVSNITGIYIGVNSSSGYVKHTGINGDTQGMAETIIPPNTFLSNASYTSDNPLFPNLKEIQINTPDSDDKFTAKNIYGLFKACSNLINININNFDSSKTEHMGDLFSNCSSLTNNSLSFLANWSNDVCTNMGSMFFGCSKLTSMVDIKMPAVTNAYFMYSYTGITSVTGNLLGTKIEDANNMFTGCSSLTTLPSDYTTIFGNNPNLTDVSSLFYGCSKLVNVGQLPVDGNSNIGYTWNETKAKNQILGKCPNVVDASYIFSDTGITEIPIAAFYNNPNLTDISGAFYSCTSMNANLLEGEGIAIGIYRHLLSKNTKLTSISSLFSNDTALHYIDYETGEPNEHNMYYNLTELKTIANLYDGCTALETTAFGLSFPTNSKKITNINGICRGMTQLRQLPEWASSNLRNYYPVLETTESAFSGCTALGYIIPQNGLPYVNAAKALSSYKSGTECFKDCTKLADYSSIPSDWK